MAPKKDTDAHLCVMFTIQGLRNTTVSVEDDTLCYEIITHFWQPHLTKISMLDADTCQMVLVAETERVPAGSTMCIIGGEDTEWIKELDFMSRDLEKLWACKFVWGLCIPESADDQRRGVHERRKDVERRWKNRRRRLQLVGANDDAKVPVA